MFEEYLQDAYEFFRIGHEASGSSNLREARRYYRASIFYAASALEAFVNYIADSFDKAQSIPQYEIAFLNDKNLIFTVDKGLIERIEFHRLEDKIRLLMYKFVPSFDFNSPAWSHFMQFKDTRDALVHPKLSDDETEIHEYYKKVQTGLSAIIRIMNDISTGIFHKPLRKQLLDLIPE
jgi:hypothetical protein